MSSPPVCWQVIETKDNFDAKAQKVVFHGTGAGVCDYYGNYITE